MKAFFLLVLLLVPVARAAEATGTEVSGLKDAVVEAAAPPDYRQIKSTGIAYLWMLGATALPALYYANVEEETILSQGILLVGIVAGPSAGQLYAGSYGHALGGFLTRVAGVGLAAGGLCAFQCSTDQEAMIAIGGLLYLGGFFHGLFGTGSAVNRANERARKAAVKTSLAPALFPLADGRLAPGLAFGASF